MQGGAFNISFWVNDSCGVLPGLTNMTMWLFGQGVTYDFDTGFYDHNNGTYTFHVDTTGMALNWYNGWGEDLLN